MKKRETVLLVDDEAMVRDSIRRLLQHSGHRVEVADCAETALKLFADHRFDLVITDFHMPGMKGTELAIRLRQQVPAQPIIMVTAFIQEFQMQGGADGCIDAVLFKPFTIKDLRETMTRVIEKHRQPPEHPSAKEND